MFRVKAKPVILKIAMKHRLSPQRFAFSVTELLVCVGVIAVLALVAFPLTRHFLESARTITCVSNLRAIGAAINAYAGDHQGRFPSLVVPEVSNEVKAVMGRDGNDRLMMSIYPYLSNPKSYRCAIVMRESTSPYLQNGRYNSTYNQNVYTFAAKPEAFPNPGRTILVYEGLPHMKISGTPPNHVMLNTPVSSVFFCHTTHRPGSRGANVLMMDGHVEQGLYYLGSQSTESTMPADGGIWGASRYTFNQ